MTPASHRAARAALDGARPARDRLGRAEDADDVSADLTGVWDGVERALQALAGTSVLTGKSLVHELRQRDLLTLSDAHALVDAQAAAVRTVEAGYAPTAADAAAVRDGFDSLLRTVESGGAPTPEPAKVSSPPPPAPVEMLSHIPTPQTGIRRNLLGRVIVAVVLLAAASVGGYYMRTMSGEPAELRRGRTAFAAGDRLTAKNAFSTAAGAHPTLAEPHIYLGRMAREEGDLATASAELRRAVELEPQNPLSHREMAAYLLLTNQLELARAFYERAIRLDPEDSNALGFMGCTLARLGRFDLAPRFLQRAGPGSWQTCAQQAVPPAQPPG